MNTIKFSWAAVLAFATFWTYGYYAALSAPNEAQGATQIVLSLFLAGIFAFFAKGHAAFKDEIKLTRREFIVPLSFLVIFGGAGWAYLNHSVTADQAYHAQRAQLHLLTFIAKLSERTPRFDNVRMVTLMHMISACVMLALAALYLALRLLPPKARLVVLVALFLGVRAAVIGAGGYADPHPPLRLLPMWLSTSMFGESDFTNRLPMLVIQCLFAWALYRKTRKAFAPTVAWLFALAAASIPVVWHASAIVEASIWTTITWTLLLLDLKREQEEKLPFPWLRWVAIVSMATLMRQPAVAAFAPLAFVWLQSKTRGKKQPPARVLALPLLVMAPFFLRSLVFGTPSTGAGAGGNVFFAALGTGVPFTAAFKDLSWLCLLAPLAFVRSLAALVLFGCGLVMFFSIPPGLHGWGRYQAEWFAPFVIMGLWIAVRQLSKLRKPATHAGIAALIGLVALNIATYRSLPALNDKSSDITRSWKVIAEYVFPYDKALAAMKAHGYSEGLYLDEALYGAFPLVVNGYTVAEIMGSVKLDRKLWKTDKAWVLSCHRPPTAAELTALDDVRAILYQRGHPNIELLKKRGWVEMQRFVDDAYGTALIALIRR